MNEVNQSRSQHIFIALQKDAIEYARRNTQFELEFKSAPRSLFRSALLLYKPIHTAVLISTLFMTGAETEPWTVPVHLGILYQCNEESVWHFKYCRCCGLKIYLYYELMSLGRKRGLSVKHEIDGLFWMPSGNKYLLQIENAQERLLPNMCDYF